ncbi:MAG: hypothetical protein J5799_03005, partial [Bacteroidales bacterium]|nr:hypothetical protein [Bacteroidales bacterium]
GFIADEDMLEVNDRNYEQYILRAGKIKREIVEEDFKEEDSRKVLNFGHTLGHAIESFSHTTECPLTHGEAVAFGMGCALWLSVNQCDLDEEVLVDYLPKMRMLLSEAEWCLTPADVDAIVAYLDHDKKNVCGEHGFVLLKDVEKPVCDQIVPGALVRQSLLELMRYMND